MINRACRIVLCLFFSAATSAHSAPWDAVIPSGASVLEYTSGGVTMSNGPGTGSMFWGREFSTPATGATAARAAVMSETATVLIGGNSIPLQATRSISAAAIAEALGGGLVAGLSAANAAAAVAAAGYAGFQIGAPVSKFLGNTQFQIGKSMCTATNTGWQCDFQAPPTPKTISEWCAGYPIFCSDTPADAVIQGLAANDGRPIANMASQGCVFNPDATAAQCTIWYWSVGSDLSGPHSSELYRQAVKNSGMKHTCPPYVDALNPAWSKPTESVVPEGQPCATGRYNGNPSPADLKARIATNPDVTAAREVAQGLLDKGVSITGVKPETIAGPASIRGTPTTTTINNPDGTTKTETKTPTTSYTYGPSTVNYTTSVVTVTNNAGNITTTTVNDAPVEATPQCKADPTLPQCAGFGELPTDKVEHKKTTVVFAEEDIGLGGGCPPPHVITVRGWGLKLNYQPACDVAPIVKPGLVALTALSCLLFIVGMVARS